MLILYGVAHNSVARKYDLSVRLCVLDAFVDEKPGWLWKLDGYELLCCHHIFLDGYEHTILLFYVALPHGRFMFCPKIERTGLFF